MHDDTEDIEILMAKFFAGEADAHERAALNEWRKKDAANEAVFQQSKKLMERLSIEDFRPEVDLAWKKVERKISVPHKTIELFPRKIVFRAAAAILILLAGAFLLNTLLVKPLSPPFVITSTNTTKKEKLPDGSSVLLSKNSKIEFASDKQGQRIAILKGEAFFEVVHDEKEPFIVSSGDVFVKDIGTAFNVRTNSVTGNTEVFVESGEVQFYTKDNTGVKLGPGESGNYNRQSGSLTKTPAGSAHTLNNFRTKSFTFRESRLEEVVDQVNMVYGSRIVLDNPALKDCRLSVTFNNEPFEVIIDVITQTLDLRAQQNGDRLILSGRGCHE